MLYKVAFLVIVLSAFDISLQQNEFVSPVLKKPRGDPTRFKIGKKAYFVQTAFTANFYRAMHDCRQRRMQLFSIANQEENDKIGRFILSNGLASGHYWTSASNLALEDGQWTWLATGNNISYTNWFPGEPSGKSTENCIEVRHWGQNGFVWNDLPCLYEGWFICETSSDCL